MQVNGRYNIDKGRGDRGHAYSGNWIVCYSAQEQMCGIVFQPRNVAIAGVSNSPFNLGATIGGILGHFGYEVKVDAVYVKSGSVNGY